MRQLRLSTDKKDMSDVTRFSGMFAKMALDYSRTGANRRGRPPGSGKSAAKATTGSATSQVTALQDERAIRMAMEDALVRRAQSKRVA